ncbi:MAG: DNA primase catalytic subunit PriS [Archaeoglobaceae archaeon]
MIAKLFIERKFAEYYAKSKIPLPREFRRREFAFVPLASLPDFVMHRHLSFRTEEEFKAYVLKNVPAHVYYSSAYYERPDAEKMEAKGWLGADLIFDIDADHLPVKSRSWEASLKLAKRELKKLLVILRKDFGIRDEDIEVYFSGSRGYHVHVHSEEFLTLGSAERREIVDYISIVAPDLRYNSNVSERANAYAARYGKSVEEAIERLRCHVDTPVTADVKRLIRLPGSLHGKTGLMVMKVEDVDAFDPLSDAVVFGDEVVAVRLLKKVRLRLRDFEIRGVAGETVKVPEYAAVFLLCRGLATY